MKSTYLANALLNHVFGGPDYVRPASIYVGLFTEAPFNGAGGVEVAGGGYARVAFVNNAANFPPAIGGTKMNPLLVQFPEAVSSWGTLVAVGLFDAATGGNLLMWTELKGGLVVNGGDILRVDNNDFTIHEE